MSDKSFNGGVSIGFPGLLTIVFITLKLTNQIAWSWVWVVSPIWIWVLIIVFALLVLGWLK